MLRAQLYIESALETRIREATTNCECLLAEASFRMKIDAARRMGLISKPLANALVGVAELRNQFAHNLSRTTLTEADDARMYGLAKGCRYNLTQAMLKAAIFEPSQVGSTTKAALVSIYLDLAIDQEIDEDDPI